MRKVYKYLKPLRFKGVIQPWNKHSPTSQRGPQPATAAPKVSCSGQGVGSHNRSAWEKHNSAHPLVIHCQRGSYERSGCTLNLPTTVSRNKCKCCFISPGSELPPLPGMQLLPATVSMTQVSRMERSFVGWGCTRRLIKSIEIKLKMRKIRQNIGSNLIFIWISWTAVISQLKWWKPSHPTPLSLCILGYNLTEG